MPGTFADLRSVREAKWSSAVEASLGLSVSGGKFLFKRHFLLFVGGLYANLHNYVWCVSHAMPTKITLLQRLWNELTRSISAQPKRRNLKRWTRTIGKAFKMLVELIIDRGVAVTAFLNFGNIYFLNILPVPSTSVILSNNHSCHRTSCVLIA